MVIRYRRAEARIYGKSDGYSLYRISYYVAGKRKIVSFAKYGDAKAEADRIVRELASGSQAAALTAQQTTEALSGIECLQQLYKETGKRFSLRSAVSELCDATKKIGDLTLGDVVERYLNTVAIVKRVPLAKAVEEYLAQRRSNVESKVNAGKVRPPSGVYEYNVAMWLKEFRDVLPGYEVCDITKEHLDAYMGSFKALSAKSRNDRRAVVKMFLREWCVPKDYLSRTHRLFEAVGMKTESAEVAEIDFYRPAELRDMLSSADAGLVPVIALGGLAGLRREEILRLDWSDVWRVAGKIEIGAKIAKGRKRRLVSICPALASWLRPYRQFEGPVWGKSSDSLEDAQKALRVALKIPARRNGLRHSFITFHMANYCDENLTAAEAGNSPQMIHEHYRALATKAEAEKWFAVKPAKSSKNLVHLPTLLRRTT